MDAVRISHRIECILHRCGLLEHPIKPEQVVESAAGYTPDSAASANAKVSALVAEIMTKNGGSK